MNKVLAALAAAVVVSTVTPAAERDEPESGFGRLNHVFLIMMENQTATDILGNANAPFINAYARQVKSRHQLFRGRTPERAELSGETTSPTLPTA